MAGLLSIRSALCFLARIRKSSVGEQVQDKKVSLGEFFLFGLCVLF